MERFAKSMDEFTGEDRKILEIEKCDGSSKYNTLEQQLILRGVLKRKWSHMGDDVPGSIFYWFKHVAAPMYEISRLRDNESGNCGICNKEIKYKYYYTRNGAEIVNLNEKYDVRLPLEIVSGSECINLTRAMKNLLNNLRENGMVGHELSFARGRILARDIVNACGTWKVESIALPLRWFYFEDWWRPIIMLGQENSGYGYHVIWQGGSNSVWGNMKKAATKDRNVRAFELFRGTDEFHEKVDIYTHGRQTADDNKYVVLTRHSAMNLRYEISGRKASLISRGIFRDDK